METSGDTSVCRVGGLNRPGFDAAAVWARKDGQHAEEGQSPAAREVRVRRAALPTADPVDAQLRVRCVRLVREHAQTYPTLTAATVAVARRERVRQASPTPLAGRWTGPCGPWVWQVRGGRRSCAPPSLIPTGNELTIC